MKIEKKALFLKAKNIGDSIILTSALSALPENYMADILCFKESEAIFSMHPNVNKVYIIPRHLRGIKYFIAYINIFLQMKLENYDVLIQFSSDWRGAFFSRFLGVKLSAAKKIQKRSSFWHKSFTHTAYVSELKRHAAEQDVDLLRRIALFNLPEAPPYHLIVPSKIKSTIKDWLDKSKNKKSLKIISIHANSRWKFKNISSSTWIELIDAFHKDNIKVVLTGSKEDFPYLDEISFACNKKPIIAENFNLQMTAAIFELSDLVISIDSMAIHLASAVKTPVVAIFGPSNELNWAPWRVKHKIVKLGIVDSPSFSCRPCGMDGCGGSKISYCLTEIKSSQIYNAAKELLN
jgi:heptosyltransferase-3